MFQEQEARTDLLRTRAKKHKLEPDTDSESQPKIRKSSDEGEVELFGGNKHVNFFSELEEGVRISSMQGTLIVFLNYTFPFFYISM